MIVKYLIILIILAFISSCDRNDDEFFQESFEGSRNVRVTEVISGTISREFNFTGRIDVDENLVVSPTNNAIIKEIRVKEGDIVRKGDILAILDDTNYKIAREDFERVERTFNRMQNLIDEEALDLSSFEEVQTVYNIAKLNYENIKKNTFILSPINGVISNIFFNNDEQFNPMTGMGLLELVNLDKVSAIVYLSDRDLKNIDSGNKAIIRVDNFPDLSFEGEVAFISPQAELGTGKFKCRVQMSKTNGMLRHNQFTRVTFLTDTNENALLIPQKSIIDDEYVFVVNNGRVEKRYVKTGIGNRSKIVVKQGLRLGEIVITDGNIGLEPDTTVNIVN